MSAPDTDIDKQKRRHWAPLLGSALVAIFAVAMIAWWAFEQSAKAPGPDTAVETTAPASGEIGAGTGGGQIDSGADPAVTTGGQGNTSGSQPGVQIDQGNGSGTAATVGAPPPAGSN